jgi:hypothetical protein
VLPSMAPQESLSLDDAALNGNHIHVTNRTQTCGWPCRRSSCAPTWTNWAVFGNELMGYWPDGEPARGQLNYGDADAPLRLCTDDHTACPCAGTASYLRCSSGRSPRPTSPAAVRDRPPGTRAGFTHYDVNNEMLLLLTTKTSSGTKIIKKNKLGNDARATMSRTTRACESTRSWGCRSRAHLNNPVGPSSARCSACRSASRRWTCRRPTSTCAPTTWRRRKRTRPSTSWCSGASATTLTSSTRPAGARQGGPER